MRSAAEQHAVEQIVQRHGHGHILRRRRGRVEQPQVVDDAHPQRGIDGADRRGGGGVAAQHGGGGAERLDDAGRAGRPEAQQIALRHIDHGLVDRTPELAQVAQPLDGARHKAGEAQGRVGVQPAAELFEPARVGEVVQRDHGRDAAPPQRQQQLAVALDRGLVEGAVARLDPAPLHREPVRVLSQRRDPIEVGRRVAPPAAGVARAIAAPDPAGLLLPVPPLVVVVLALDLVGCRGRAPEEARREAAWRHSNGPFGPRCSEHSIAQERGIKEQRIGALRTRVGGPQNRRTAGIDKDCNEASPAHLVTLSSCHGRRGELHIVNLRVAGDKGQQPRSLFGQGIAVGCR